MNIHRQENEPLSKPHTLYKINSRWITDLSVKRQPIKSSEEKNRENLQDIELVRVLNIYTGRIIHKFFFDKLDFIKVKKTFAL